MAGSQKPEVNLLLASGSLLRTIKFVEAETLKCIVLKTIKPYYFITISTIIKSHHNI